MQAFPNKAPGRRIFCWSKESSGHAVRLRDPRNDRAGEPDQYGDRFEGRLLSRYDARHRDDRRACRRRDGRDRLSREPLARQRLKRSFAGLRRSIVERRVKAASTKTRRR